MSSFTSDLIVQHLDGIRWKLMKKFCYYMTNGFPEVICVPSEFITDFASIPSLFWSVIGHPTGRYGKSAVLHDYLYVRQQFTRSRADRIFLQSMRVLKVGWLRRRIMWLAVRIGGIRPWNNYKKKLA